jgi:hypothetical protein
MRSVQTTSERAEEARVKSTQARRSGGKTGGNADEIAVVRRRREEGFPCVRQSLGEENAM